MAKRVYTPKIQPIAVQIHIQRAVVVQFETALEEAQKMEANAVKHRIGFGGHPMSDAEIAHLTNIVTIREQQLAEAQRRLVTLEAQQAA